MKIVNVIGGLGNQMFQYAFACYLKHQFPNEEILLDTHHFVHYKLHNGYELNRVFPNLSIPIASKEQVKKLTRYIPHYKLSRLARKLLPVLKTEYLEKEIYTFDETIGVASGDYYYEGYWQAIPYCNAVKQRILEEFCFPQTNTYNMQMATMIQSTQSVGIHIRRGDYLNLPEFTGICDLDYYRQAITQIMSKNTACEFVIFSNDINWCRDNIEPLLSGAPVYYVDGNRGADSCWDIYLMSQCENLIIANSSFSWWAAFLNQRVKKVYAPKVWWNRTPIVDLYDEKWGKI